MQLNEPHTLYLIGAYGRQATRIDWEKGKDFQIYQGPYCSIRDKERMKADGIKKIVIVQLNQQSKQLDVVHQETL